VAVRTRFAPSPTGYLHIGGVRTALFGWLFARQQGGQFILRIDDTDQARNVEAALAPILHGLRWLGIDWDEGPEVGGPYGPYYQSQRQGRYQAAVARLLEWGLAYRDYATSQEIQGEREAATTAKRPFVYSRRWLAETPADAARFESEGRQGVVRLKMPREGTLTIDDQVRGTVVFEWAHEQDHVIQRADGSCLYHLASVVDDHDFRITHVIRAEEHLSNTPRQVFIAQSLGYALPVYAHLPYVAEPASKNKLSKRKLETYLKHPEFARLNDHGRRIAQRLGLPVAAETFNPVVVDFYEQVGYLPDALVNYLLLLGWALDDKTEYFTRDEMVRHFSLERVNKAPASFDPKKLWAIEDQYMRRLPLDEKVEMMMPFLRRSGVVAETADAQATAKVKRVVEAAGDRIKVAGDILEYDAFFVGNGAIEYDERAFDDRLRKPPQVGELLRAFCGELPAVEPFSASAIEARFEAFVEAKGIKPADLVHAIRIAVTGKPVGFGLFDTLAILGRQSCIARIERALARMEGKSQSPAP